MSKIGQKLIQIPDGTQVEIQGQIIKITGPKDSQELSLPHFLTVSKAPTPGGSESRPESVGKENTIKVERKNNDKKSKAFHGLFRSLINNAVTGVSVGFTKKLDFKGVGFKAEVQGQKIILSVGFSHPVELTAPEKIELKVEKNVISVSGTDAQKVGQFAAEIRAIKPVEPYKGKGIKYIDEIPRRKPGKAAKAAIGSGS